MAKKAAQTPTVTIRVTGPEKGRYRTIDANGRARHFTPEVQEFTDFDLTEAEIDELRADHELKVELKAFIGGIEVHAEGRQSLADQAAADAAAAQAANDQAALDKIASDMAAAKAAEDAAATT